MKNKNGVGNTSSSKLVSRANILNAISDDKSFSLFRAIALKGNNGYDGGSILMSEANLTRKQYYARMSDMVRAGLLKKKSGRYFLTSLGKVVYNDQQVIESALTNYWKLKAIDSVETLDESSKEEYGKLVDTLIGNHRIKEIILAEVV